MILLFRCWVFRPQLYWIFYKRRTTKQVSGDHFYSHSFWPCLKRKLKKFQRKFFQTNFLSIETWEKTKFLLVVFLVDEYSKRSKRSLFRLEVNNTLNCVLQPYFFATCEIAKCAKERVLKRCVVAGDDSTKNHHVYYYQAW